MRRCIQFVSGALCGALVLTGSTVSSFAAANPYADSRAVGVVSEGTIVSEDASTDSNEIVTYEVGKDTLPYSEEEIYSQLFDIHNKVKVDLDMSNEEMAKLERDFEKNSNSPIYRMGNITFTITLKDGTTIAYYIPEVGIRMKGNMTRNKFFDISKNKVYDLIHYKISFKETFDDVADGYNNGEYYINENGESTWKLNADGTENKDGKAARKIRKGRVFGGMEKLDLKWNGNYDNTYIREYYAYKVFNSEGVMAPQQGLCSMNFGDVARDNVYHLGVYSIHECIDEVFINRHLKNEADQGGDLYKAAWAGGGANLTKSTSIGISDDFTGKNFNYDLKTNKKTSAEAGFPSLRNVINGLNTAGLTKETFSKYVDVDNFIKFAAVSYFMGNPDDVRNNYNNHYIYVYPETSEKAGQMMYIPYDYDRTLGVTIGWNPDGTGMTDVSPFSVMADGNRSNQVNPLYVYGIGNNGFYINEYKAELENVLKNELITPEAFAKEYEIAKNLYADDAAISSNLELVDATGSSGGGKWQSDERIAKFVFSNEDDEEKENYISARSNITVANYINAIKANYQVYKAEANIEDGYYIESAATKWKAKPGYMMTYDKASGTYTYELKTDENLIFIIGHTNGDMYRYKFITGTVPKGISENIAGNIIAEPGTYLIKFDEAKKTISISLPGENESVKVKFDANGGSRLSKSSINASSGKKLGTLPTVKKKNYTFAGWYTKKSGGSKVTSSTKCSFTKTTTLYAHWNKVSVGAAKIKSATNTSKSVVTIKLNSVKKAKGYEVEYATNSKYTSSNKVNSTSTTATIKKLKKGYTYYVRVRAFAKDSTGAKVYGKYATTKIKITK